MPRRLRWFLPALFASALGGCGRPPDGADSAPVSGSVTLDGEPLAEGEISFVIPGEWPSTLRVEEGAFSGSARVGANRVEIRRFKIPPVAPLAPPEPDKIPSKRNVIPERFSDRSELAAEVATGAANEFRFGIESR